MKKTNPKILYISSANPLKGPGAIGMTHYLCIKNAGFNVDFLTLYPVKNHPEILHVKNKITSLDIIKERVKRKLGIIPWPHYNFFYKKESNPPVSVNRILKIIGRDYDWVIIYFWQRLLSFQTVEAIYDSLNHPVVFFIPPDYSHMSGGCHFPGECKRYQIGCGCCPVFNSNNPNDFTHWNVLYRKRVYEKIRPVVFGNTYMQRFYCKSYLLKGIRLEKSIPKINTKLYHPIEKDSLRNKYGVPPEITFIIAFGCQNLSNERKGMKYLIEALHLWYSQLSNSERRKVLVLTAGGGYESIKESIPFNSIGLGMIEVGRLSEFYSLADIFVCPSVNDAGPSMVGQSIACGTPVVGFEMGALLDHVKDKNTGYCAELANSKDLAHGIELYFRMSKEERDLTKIRCLEWARTCGSIDTMKTWLDVYRKYHNEKNS